MPVVLAPTKPLKRSDKKNMMTEAAAAGDGRKSTNREDTSKMQTVGTISAGYDIDFTTAANADANYVEPPFLQVIISLSETIPSKPDQHSEQRLRSFQAAL